jgi:hypothetical protein
MTRSVAVVAHTHWDREWHTPFEAFRARLVDLLDRLLPELAGDPTYQHFLLDGQLAALDDYLAVRPEAEAMVAGLVEAGRLSVGPWYVLMDEFCVSAETIVRNLQLGRRRAARLGGAMAVGYLPDMFGHVAQMPQLLQLAGIDHAVVWRGVPAAVNRTAFWWSAPDGSRVRAEYLPVGYANGAFLPLGAADLVRRVRAHERELGTFLAGPDTPLLLMNGTDHQAPRPDLPALLAEANRTQSDLAFGQTSLEDYLAAAPVDDLPEWSGELRSGARAPLLMGVLSNRVDIKAAAARVERALERLAEPLAALWLPPEDWPGWLLDSAWLSVIRNAAHDSICACSADPVGRAVLQRYDGALAQAEAVTRQALDLAAVATADAGPVVINPGPVAASGVVSLVLAGTEAPAGTQQVEVVSGGVEIREGRGRDLARLLGELTRDGWLPDGRPTRASVVAPDGAQRGEVGALGGGVGDVGPGASSAGGVGGAAAGAVEVDLWADAADGADPAVAGVLAEAWAQAGAWPDEPLVVRVHRSASQRVQARVEGVPGYGWSVWQPDGVHGVGSDGAAAVSGGGTWLDNGLARIDVDPATGTFALNGRPGYDRLVDGGDEGDTYNYSPPAEDRLVDRPAVVVVEPVEAGPVRGRIRVRRWYEWPAQLTGGRRTGAVAASVVTDLELRAGEPLVRVTTTFDNLARDHRLRTFLPLPEVAQESVAECAFGTVRRGQPEGGDREPALATFPSRRWVAAGGLTVTHEGLLEYELITGEPALALTLLRATGVLSRPAPPARPNLAGPALELTDTQMVGPHRVRYALAVGDRDPWRLADLAWMDLPVVYGSGGGPLPVSGSRLTVTGAEVASLQRVDGAIEVRVFNPSDQAALVGVPGHRGQVVDLAGRPVDTWDGEMIVGPWGIATLRLEARSLDP